MENLVEKIIGGFLTATPLILIIFKMFASEFVTNFTKELFNSKTKKKANFIFNSIIITLLVIGLSIFFKSYLLNEKPIKEINNQPQQVITTQKTDAEIVFEVGKYVASEAKEIVNNKKEKNNEIIANRAKRLVYKIGDIQYNEKSILSIYKKIIENKNIDNSRIFIFQIDNNQYFLYKDDLFNEKQITDSLLNFKLKMENIEPKIEIINLMEYCKIKENIVEYKPFKKGGIKIRQFKCK